MQTLAVDIYRLENRFENFDAESVATVRNISEKLKNVEECTTLNKSNEGMTSDEHIVDDDPTVTGGESGESSGDFYIKESNGSKSRSQIPFVTLFFSFLITTTLLIIQQHPRRELMKQKLMTLVQQLWRVSEQVKQKLMTILKKLWPTKKEKELSFEDTSVENIRKIIMELQGKDKLVETLSQKVSTLETTNDTLAKRLTSLEDSNSELKNELNDQRKDWEKRFNLLEQGTAMAIARLVQETDDESYLAVDKLE